MKRFVLYSLLLCIAVCSTAQTKLPDSRRSSVYSYIYTISHENLRQIHLEKREIHEDMLGEYITKYNPEKGFPQLPSGNYIIVYAKENNMIFSDYTKDDLCFQVVPSKEFRLSLYDLAGKPIKDAVVKYKGKEISFDPNTQIYNRKRIKDNEIIEIEHKGVFHYLEIRQDRPYWATSKKSIVRTAKQKFRNIRYKIKPPGSNESNFIVFSKPIYKPGETVKLKAYITDHKGNPYRKEMNINLYGYAGNNRIDTTLVNLKPYRPGMYEYQFELSDSLELKPDNNYTICFENKRKRFIANQFRYEEYELKSTRFEMTTPKKEYLYKEPVELTISVTDENDLAVYDGRIELLVTAASLPEGYMNKRETVFVPDTLWYYTVDIDNITDKKILLPDTIFPADVSLDFRVQSTYLSADNEKRVQRKELTRRASSHTLDFSLSGGILHVKELHNGEAEPVSATIRIIGETGELVSTESMMLPNSIPVPWFASRIQVETPHGSDTYNLSSVQDRMLGHRFYRSADSVYLKVNNPAGVPFWYSIYRKKKQIAKGYTSSGLDYAVKDDGKNGYAMELTYLAAGKSKTITGNLPFVRKEFTVDVSTPATVYPGQTTDVIVSVADKKGKPVKNVDITAYSFTSKFQNSSAPSIPVKRKVRQAERHKTEKYIPGRNSISGKIRSLNWEKWKGTLGLDKNEYYKFLYPDTWYSYTEPTTDGSTLVSPYVVIDGVLQGVHLMWIDDKLYYYSKTDHWDRSVFAVSPGWHTFRFRTYDRLINVERVYITEGQKNILSFQAGTSFEISRKGVPDDRLYKVTSTLLEEKDWGKLLYDEKKELLSELISIDNNFREYILPGGERIDMPVSIESGKTFYYLNPDAKKIYNNVLRGYVKNSILTGPFPDREIRNGLPGIGSVYVADDWLVDIGLEGGYKYTLYDNYQKLKNWDDLPGGSSFSGFIPEADFSKRLFNSPEDLKEYHDSILKSKLSGFSGQIQVGLRRIKDDLLLSSKERMTLYLGKDSDGNDIRPAFIYIDPQENKGFLKPQLYYGGTRSFSSLPAGKMVITLVFSDMTSYSKTVRLFSGGRNYIRLDSVVYQDNSFLAKEAFRLFNQSIRKSFPPNPYTQEVFTGNNSYDELIITEVLQGRVAGVGIRDDGEININVRGSASVSEAARPLIIVDGMPYEGSLEDLDPSVFASMNILKDAASTAIYGARAADGVILIQTGGAGVILTNEEVEDDLSIPDITMEQGNTMRRNFHDDAFWQPRLQTDAKGEAIFEVTYPDDITRWNAWFLAIGKKKRADKKQLAIRSFKTLSARLSTPRFAIRGDSLNLIGRITNHSGDSVRVEKSIHQDGLTQKERVTVASSFVESVPVQVSEGDSIRIGYSLEMENGYFDGEERSFPVFEQGMLQTSGEFKVLYDTVTHLFPVDTELGEATLYAEDSGLHILLREVEKIDRYPYMCNEQIASKIKALLAKRKICRVLEKEFKEDKSIEELITRLMKNRNPSGLWGWWNRGNTQHWISLHVVSALLDAREEGFKVEVEVENICRSVERELKAGLDDLPLIRPDEIPWAKQELLNRLLILKRLGAVVNYENYFRRIHTGLQNQTVNDELKTMQTMLVIGLEKEIEVDVLMKYSSSTMLGGLYWGGKGAMVSYIGYGGLLPYDNHTEKTLIAYQILKNRGGYEAELKKIQSYFFEARRGGSWQNIYEASRIIETILPDMLQAESPYQQTMMFVNGEKITEFPYTGTFSLDKAIEIRKEGTLPLFVTTYQQEWNRQPEAESAKGIAVKSYFIANKDTVSYLQAGKVVRLEVNVQMDSAAEYVQIEVPVPAGCSYETKTGVSYGKEIHREHFKEKVVIFCDKLEGGEHRFRVELIPRYTGRYSLNPAKAELMYFPTFYGNEEIKAITIE